MQSRVEMLTPEDLQQIRAIVGEVGNLVTNMKESLERESHKLKARFDDQA
jgi:hypothetical protein